MKAVIIAAGMGKRLRPLTENTPKSMLPINNVTMLQRATDIFQNNLIKDIAVIRGFCADKISSSYPLTFFNNNDFEVNNILHSLFYAKSFLNGDLIISYSDIIFKDEVVKKALSFQGDIGVVIDKNWRSIYDGRDAHPLSEAEVSLVENQKVKLIGKNSLPTDQATGEFIGMIKLSSAGVEIFKKEFEKLCQTIGTEAPFQRASRFQNAYLTDFLQYLIEKEYKIEPIFIEGGWMEIDTFQDYQKAQSFYEN